MPSIADTAARLVATGVPVLLLDTCSILDVIRAPERGRKLAGCVEAASELLAMATANPSGCNLVVGSFVPQEWNDNAQSELDRLTAHLDRLDEYADHFHRLCGHLGITLGFSQPHYNASGLANRLHALSQQLLHTAIALDPHQDTILRSHARAAAKRRPSQKGEVKDCTIFEECLEVCRQLQVVTFARKVVFCSSNTNDYCEPRATPHTEIAADCNAVGLQFTTNLPWAVSVLKS